MSDKKELVPLFMVSKRLVVYIDTLLAIVYLLILGSVIVGGLTGIVYVLRHYAPGGRYREANTFDYARAATMCRANPNVRAVIEKALEDGVMTNSEFAEIESESGRVALRVVVAEKQPMLPEYTPIPLDDDLAKKEK